jgi:hypothetical protein
MRGFVFGLATLLPLSVVSTSFSAPDAGTSPDAPAMPAESPEAAQQRECADVAGVAFREKRNAGAARAACLKRFEDWKAEFETLFRKIATWQPRGYNGAGEGLEALPDSELETIPDELPGTLDRLMWLATRLHNKTLPFSSEEKGTAVREVQGFVAAEKACRVDKKCMGARAARKTEEEFFASVVSPMCGADQSREQALAAMAHERANPSGYIDVVLLHRLGADVQSAQEQIAGLTPAYTKVRKHPWKGWRSECAPPAGVTAP